MSNLSRKYPEGKKIRFKPSFSAPVREGVVESCELRHDHLVYQITTGEIVVSNQIISIEGEDIYEHAEIQNGT